MNDKPRITLKEARLKAASYCAYRERTQQELRNKLYNDGLFGDEVEEVVTAMIEENFINEERYAKSFAGGKFRINSWGRIKIKLALKQKNISPYCIQEALKEIEDTEYIQTIDRLIRKRIIGPEEKGDFVKKNKAVNYLLNKGFETELVWERLNDIINSD